MIYLTNTVSAQTVSIPRNDNGGTPSVNPRSYQEGYNAGEAHQKSLLSSTAITENGEYSRENGFSAVSVNVPQTGSSLPLTAITITANTAITETEKAYTGITVNVDTASTYNSGYTDGYASGYTSGETDGYNTGYASGETIGENNIISTFTAITATTNGVYGSSAHPLSSITVNVIPTGSTAKLVDYVCAQEMTDYSDYTDGIELGDVWTTNTEFRIKGIMTGNETGNGVLTNYDGNGYAATRWFWTNGNMYYDFDNDRIDTPFTSVSGTVFDYTISNWGVYDNLTETYVMSGTPKSYISPGIVWLNMCTCRISSIEVKQGNNIIINGFAACDENNNIGLYDFVSRTMLYNSGLPMTYGSVLYPDYVSGYTSGFTDGYNTGYVSGNTDGYISGETHQKSLLEAISITENGQYNKVDGYSAITVDIPIGVKYIEYIETTDTRPKLDTGIKFNSLNQSLELDAMVFTQTGPTYAFYFLLGTYSTRLHIYYSNWNRHIRTEVYGKTHSVGQTFDLSYTENKRTKIGISCTGITVDGVVKQSFNQTSLETTNYTVKLNGSVNYSGGTESGCYARYYGYKMFSGETLMMDLKPVLDNNDTPCFYDTVSKKLFYFTETGDGSRIQAGPLLGYNSGYTDGYSSGYTSGQTSIIDTFTGRTVTENGTYGSSAHPLSSITVNVLSGVGEFNAIYGDEVGFEIPLPANNNSIYNLAISVAYIDGKGYASLRAEQTGDAVYEYAHIYDDIFYGEYVIKYSGGLNSGHSSTTISGIAASLPDVGVLKLGKGYASYTNGSSVSAFTASSLTNTADTLTITFDNACFISGVINNVSSCLLPHIDNQGNVCISFNGNTYYPTSGKAYPVYKNGNDYYIKMV